MTPDQIARDEADFLATLMAAGQRAAALDGRHLLVWGVAAALVLTLQYAAEVGDWLPSRLLWLWQPLALAGFTASIFLARRGAGRRLGHPVSRTYALAFAAVGIGFGLYLIAAGTGGVPDALTSALLLSGGMGLAFLTLGLATPLRWMLVAAAGWWALFGFHAAAGALVPVDWLRFAAAFLLLLALPGVVLVVRRPA